MYPWDILKEIKRLYRAGYTKNEAEAELLKVMSQADMEWGFTYLGWFWPPSWSMRQRRRLGIKTLGR